MRKKGAVLVDQAASCMKMKLAEVVGPLETTRGQGGKTSESRERAKCSGNRVTFQCGLLEGKAMVKRGDG